MWVYTTFYSFLPPASAPLRLGLGINACMGYLLFCCAVAPHLDSPPRPAPCCWSGCSHSPILRSCFLLAARSALPCPALPCRPLCNLLLLLLPSWPATYLFCAGPLVRVWGLTI